MSNVLYRLPPLDLGFKNRLEAIEGIVKGELITFPNGARWSINNVFVKDDNIVDRPCHGAFSLRRHVEWLRDHVSRAAMSAPRRKVFTPINLPPKSGNKQERLDAVNTLCTINHTNNQEEVAFIEGLVSFDSCRVVNDQIVTEWERGTGFRIETERRWLQGQIDWEERQANRPAFQPKQAARSVHPGKQGIFKGPTGPLITASVTSKAAKDQYALTNEEHGDIVKAFREARGVAEREILPYQVEAELQAELRKARNEKQRRIQEANHAHNLALKAEFKAKKASKNAPPPKADKKAKKEEAKKNKKGKHAA